MASEKSEGFGIGLIGAGLVAWFVVWVTKDKPTPPPAPPQSSFVITETVTPKPEYGGLMDGTIDAARDRAIAKAGTSWPEIQKWVGQFRRVMDALDPANKPRAAEANIPSIPVPPASGREIKLPDKQPARQPAQVQTYPSGRFRVWRSY